LGDLDEGDGEERLEAEAVMMCCLRDPISSRNSCKKKEIP
jgi:hypothetical protein